MKLALALAFAPVCLLILAIATKLPLPSLPFINPGGNQAPEYVFFVANTPTNLPGAVLFSAICLCIGIALFVYLAIERGSIKSAWHDCLDNLKKDFSEVLNGQPKTKTTIATKQPEVEKKEVVYKSLLVGKRRVPNDTPETIL